MKLQLTVCFLLISLVLSAGDKSDINTPSFLRHEVNLAGGLSTNGYLDSELSYTYMLNRTFGLSAGMNLSWDVADDPSFLDYYSSEEITMLLDIKTIMFRPSLRIKFPLYRQNGEDVLALNIEPGVYLPIGNEKRAPNLLVEKIGSYKLDWWYSNIKTFFSLDFSPGYLSLGYMITDFSHRSDRFRLNHTFFIQVGTSF